MVKTRENLNGMRFGKLTVVEQVEDYISPRGVHAAQWKCRCDCGKIAIVRGDFLKCKKTRSCGCLSAEISKERCRTLVKKRKALVGQRFGRLVVLKIADEDYVDKNGKHYAKWWVQCDCGSEPFIVLGANLTCSRTKSCGCLQKESVRKNRKHFGCMRCGSDKHYAKGYCKNCYAKNKRWEAKCSKERRVMKYAGRQTSGINVPT